MRLTYNFNLTGRGRLLLWLALMHPLVSHADLTINSATASTKWNNTGSRASISLSSLFPSENSNALNIFTSVDPAGGPKVVTQDVTYGDLMSKCRDFSSTAADCSGKYAFGRVVRPGAPASQSDMNRMAILNGSNGKRYLELTVQNGIVSFEASQIKDTEIGFIDLAYYRGEVNSPFSRCDSETVVCGSKIVGCPAAPASVICSPQVSASSASPPATPPASCNMRFTTVSTTQPTSNTASDGKIMVSTSGGTSPVTYSINPQPSSNPTGTFDLLKVNNYTINATDSTSPISCTSSVSVPLTAQAAAPSGTATPPPPSCACYAPTPNPILCTGSAGNCGAGGYQYALSSNALNCQELRVNHESGYIEIGGAVTTEPSCLGPLTPTGASKPLCP